MLARHIDQGAMLPTLFECREVEKLMIVHWKQYGIDILRIGWIDRTDFAGVHQPREKQAHAPVFGLGEFNILVISLVVVGVAKFDRVFAEIVDGFIFQCGQGDTSRFDMGRESGPY